jgi:hypothetical protein
MKAFVLIGMAACALQALGAVTVNAPQQNAKLVSPFWLSASATACSNQPIVSMGYSFDNSSNTTTFTGSSISTSVSAPLGSTTLHVKSWGNQGANCTTNVSITIVPDPATTVPSNATVASNLQNSTWKAPECDTGTGINNAQYQPCSGNSPTSGTQTLQTSPSLSGHSLEFVTSYYNDGGERFAISFANDQNAENYLYDTWAYVKSDTHTVANLEFDMNQVTSNGQTVIYGFQCDGWNQVWDYTENAGTAAKPVDTWVHSSDYCNPSTWSTNTWHHVQISYSRNTSGDVTYHAVWLDGVEEDINQTVFSSFSLGWGIGDLLSNFQEDGNGASGTMDVYLDKLTISRW